MCIYIYFFFKYISSICTIELDNKLKFLWRRATMKTVRFLRFVRFVRSDCNRSRLDSIDLIKESVLESSSKSSSRNSAETPRKRVKMQWCHATFLSLLFFFSFTYLDLAYWLSHRWKELGHNRGATPRRIPTWAPWLPFIVRVIFSTSLCKNAPRGHYVKLKRPVSLIPRSELEYRNGVSYLDLRLIR